MAKEVKIGDIRLGADSPTFTFIGGPCVIEDREITLKEQGSCGNHRGIKCFFDDTFTRRKDPKPARKK